jgi:carbon monoxide dehydrogenase subunit G
MGKIEVVQEIAAPASAAWEKLSDFGGIGKWMPGVERCDVEGDGIGAVRHIVFPGGGGGVKERLESFDAEGRSLSYAITEGPMPVQDYLATIRVSETGENACRVDWTASFELPEGVPTEAVEKGISGAYGGSLRALKKLLEG